MRRLSRGRIDGVAAAWHRVDGVAATRSQEDAIAATRRLGLGRRGRTEQLERRHEEAQGLAAAGLRDAYHISPL